MHRAGSRHSWFLCGETRGIELLWCWQQLRIETPRGGGEAFIEQSEKTKSKQQNTNCVCVCVCACFVPGPCRSWVQGSLAWLCVPLPSRGPVFAKTVSLLCLGTWSLLGHPCVCGKVLSVLAFCVGIVPACLYVRGAGAVIQVLDHALIENLLTWPSEAKLPTL